MRMLRLWHLVGGCAVVFMACALFARDATTRPKTEVTFDNWRFKLPHGWRMTEKDRSMVLNPMDLPAGKHEAVAIVLSPGTPLSADSKHFRSAFDTVIGQAHAELKIVSSEKVQSTNTDDGYEVLTAVYRVESRFGEKTTRFYLAAHPGSRFEILVFSASSEEVFRKYEPALQEFISSVQFVNLAGKANAATGPATGPATAPATGPATRPATVPSF